MMSRRWGFRISLLSTAMLVSLLPVAPSTARGVAASGAQCETCCPEQYATCVICGTKSCVTSTSYYQGRIGSPCSRQLQPNAGA